MLNRRQRSLPVTVTHNLTTMRVVSDRGDQIGGQTTQPLTMDDGRSQVSKLTYPMAKKSIALIRPVYN